MLEILQFVFSSFWMWAGTVVLIYALASGSTHALAALATAVRGRR